MNIYFACSITGGRQQENIYQLIVESLLSEGHIVPTADLSRPEVMDLEGIVQPREVYKRDISWIKACQALIAEVTTPSHGVGYEIAYALGLGKPVLCCYQRGARVSKMITGNTEPHLRVGVYQTQPEVLQLVRNFLEEIKRTSQVNGVS
jgi:nucleoside 2-deoxyribosyltransferase